MSLTAVRAHDLLAYDPLTGALTWRINRGPRRAGSVAGSPTSDGYWRVTLDRCEYQAHRVAWLMETGAWPSDKIDHRDGDKQNNAWNNLRDVSGQINTQNQRRAARGSHSGLLGVTANGNRWEAQIGHDGATRYLGLYETKELAHQAYLEVKRSLHAGCTI